MNLTEEQSDAVSFPQIKPYDQPLPGRRTSIVYVRREKDLQVGKGQYLCEFSHSMHLLALVVSIH